MENEAMRRNLTFALLLIAALATAGRAQNKPTRDEQVRQDKQAFAPNTAWFYDNLDAAIEQAGRSNRPLMIVFR